MRWEAYETIALAIVNFNFRGLTRERAIELADQGAGRWAICGGGALTLIFKEEILEAPDYFVTLDPVARVWVRDPVQMAWAFVEKFGLPSLGNVILAAGEVWAYNGRRVLCAASDQLEQHVHSMFRENPAFIEVFQRVAHNAYEHLGEPTIQSCIAKRGTGTEYPLVLLTSEAFYYKFLAEVQAGLKYGDSV